VMNIQFQNGASVSRLYKDGMSEVLAAFQYHSHAQDFASLIAKQDDEAGMNTVMMVTCHHSGDLAMFGRWATP